MLKRHLSSHLQFDDHDPTHLHHRLHDQPYHHTPPHLPHDLGCLGAGVGHLVTEKQGVKFGISFGSSRNTTSLFLMTFFSRSYSLWSDSSWPYPRKYAWFTSGLDLSSFRREHGPYSQTLLSVCMAPPNQSTPSWVHHHPKKKTDGDRFMRSTAVLIVSLQKGLDNFECDSIYLIHSQIVLLILSATPLCWGVFWTLLSSLIPCTQPYCPTFPACSAPLFAWIHFSLH